MNSKLKTTAMSVSVSLACLAGAPAHASGFLADLGQTLGILTLAQAQRADQGWAAVRDSVPGLTAAEQAASGAVRGAVVGAATYYGGPLAPIVGNALVNQHRAQLDAARQAASTAARPSGFVAPSYYGQQPVYGNVPSPRMPVYGGYQPPEAPNPYMNPYGVQNGGWMPPVYGQPYRGSYDPAAYGGHRGHGYGPAGRSPALLGPMPAPAPAYMVPGGRINLR